MTMPGCVSSGSSTICTFVSTGAEQSFKVPAGVTQVGVKLVGAPGGNGGKTGILTPTGGKGGTVNATLTNLCQSVTVGPLTLRTTAGNVAGRPVVASNLVTDVSSLAADSATFTNINIGQDMGQFSNPALTFPAARGSGPNVTTVNVPAGTFGQTATAASLGGLRQVANGTSASSFTLPNLTVAFGGAC